MRAFKISGCAKCGVRYPTVDWSELEIDHIDPRDRSQKNGRLHRMSVDETFAELLKCQVLCKRCHREKHHGMDLIEGQIALFAGNGSWHYNGR